MDQWKSNCWFAWPQLEVVGWHESTSLALFYHIFLFSFFPALLNRCGSAFRSCAYLGLNYLTCRTIWSHSFWRFVKLHFPRHSVGSCRDSGWVNVTSWALHRQSVHRSLLLELSCASEVHRHDLSLRCFPHLFLLFLAQSFFLAWTSTICCTCSWCSSASGCWKLSSFLNYEFETDSLFGHFEKHQRSPSLPWPASCCRNSYTVSAKPLSSCSNDAHSQLHHVSYFAWTSI